MSALFSFQSVTKTFGKVTANRNVSFEVSEKTIHGVVGENGAGKSTIMKTLYGMYQPDSGSILLKGNPVVISSPFQAIHLGIGMVHQHFMLVPTLTVWQNIVLGLEPTLWKLRYVDVKARLKELLSQYGGQLDLQEKVENLSVGEEQQVEILKLLYRNADILILDEPTAVLTPQEVKLLFEQLFKLRSQGKTIVLVTHKLKEILSGTDAVTVMRQGEVVGTWKTTELSEALLAEKIVGKKRKALPTERTTSESEPVLQLREVNFGNTLKNLNITVHKREIVGIAGIEGNGQSELVRLMSGLESKYEGEILYQGENIRDAETYALRQKGYLFIPPDRHKDGLLLNSSLTDNLILGHQREGRFTEGPLISGIKTNAEFKKQTERFDVRPPDPRLAAKNLSGGNQQKLIVAREFNFPVHCLIACHPTRGVDIGAADAIHSEFLRLREEGAGILLLSSELEEIFLLADRILVIFKGAIVGEVSTMEAKETQIGLWMTGGSA